MKRLLSIFSAVALSLFVLNAYAQGVEETMFKYPVAPDTCSTLESRCNYIVVNFWNEFDIAHPIKDDAMFEKTFRDYVNFFKYSHRNIVLSSVRNFIFKARANSANLLKVGVAAEAALYGPNAEFWSDELYIEVAKAMAESSHLKAADRNYYKHQVEVISKNLEGLEIPSFDIQTSSGKIKIKDIEAESFLLFFTDDGAGSIIDRTRMSTDVGVNWLIEQGKLKVVQIYVGKPAAGWLETQPETWVNGSCDQVMDILDVRAIPSCIILNKDRQIVTKNVTVEEVKAAVN